MREGRFKYHTVEIPIYYGRVHILVGHDLAALSRAAGVGDQGFNGLSLAQYQAYSFTGEKETTRGYFALFRPDASAGLLAHEAVHLVNKIFADRGVKLDIENDEPQAYLMGWLVNQMNYALTSKSIRAKKNVKLL
jgi:hypothetical protein